MPLFSIDVHTAKETKGYTVASDAVATLASFAFGTQNGLNVKRLIITAGANPLRITWSKTDPTATLGHYIAAYGTYELDGQINCQNIRLIATTGTSVTSVTLET